MHELIFAIYESLDGSRPVFDREFMFGRNDEDINEFRCIGLYEASGSFLQYLNSGAIILLVRGDDGHSYDLFPNHVFDRDYPETVHIGELWRPPHERD